jgi:3-hydroxypropanoate dehydrogenase
MAASEQSLESLREEAQRAVQALRERRTTLDSDSIDVILSGARSHYAWTDKPVAQETLEELYRITASGPTSMNTCPARFVFVTSAEGKARLAKSLKEKNVDKMMGAPVTAIIAFDLDFWKQLPVLFPHEDRTGFFRGEEKRQYSFDTAFRNSTLQGGYFMLAARALGLDVGAMSGFSNAVVDEEFFAGTSLRSNFLCNLGYADETALFQKLPRLEFNQACSFQ